MVRTWLQSGSPLLEMNRQNAVVTHAWVPCSNQKQQARCTYIKLENIVFKEKKKEIVVIYGVM